MLWMLFKREAWLAIALYFVTVACVHAQQPQQPPVQYQIQYQPAAVPGQYYYVPRMLPILDCVLGPRYVFIPQQQPVQGQR